MAVQTAKPPRNIGLIFESQPRSDPASRHKARLIAGLTKMRATSRSRATALRSFRCAGV